MIKQAPIALIAFAATAAVVAHSGLNAYREKALPAAAAGQCAAFELAADAYRKDHSKWPPVGSNAEVVTALMGDPKIPFEDREDYLALTTHEENVPLFVEPDPPGSDNYVALDVWNQQLRFEVTGNIMKVTSAGPDRKFGTPDDITSADHPPASE